jgi:hypothetical protein
LFHPIPIDRHSRPRESRPLGELSAQLDRQGYYKASRLPAS